MPATSANHEGSVDIWATMSQADVSKQTQCRLFSFWVVIALHAWALHHQNKCLTWKATS